MTNLSEDEQNFIVLCSNGGSRTALIKNLTEIIRSSNAEVKYAWVVELLDKVKAMTNEELDSVIDAWIEKYS